jgi:hypothetical protein
MHNLAVAAGYFGAASTGNKTPLAGATMRAMLAPPETDATLVKIGNLYMST